MTTPHPRLAHAVRRFADANSARITTAAATGVPLFGNVATVTPGAGAGGTAAITVTWFGQRVPAKYLNSYTPVVGDRVAFGYDGKQVVVFGKVIG
jgi:hypothetical protein